MGGIESSCWGRKSSGEKEKGREEGSGRVGGKEEGREEGRKGREWNEKGKGREMGSEK